MQFMAKEQEIGAYSAYAIAVKHGYVGTEEDWIEEQERNRKASEQAASDASDAKTAAEAAQRAAENAKAGAESAKSAAADSAASARLSVSKAAQSASDAESAKTAAGEAQKAAESAKSAAAVSASLAQESAAQAAGSAESANSAKTAAAQSEQRTAASEANVAQAEERINTAVSGAVEAVTAQETKSVQAVAAQGEASVAAVTAEGERVLGTIPADYTAAVGEIDTLKKSKAEIDDTVIDGDTWSSKHIVDMLCPKVEKSGTLVQMDGMLGGYLLGVKVSWMPTQEGSGDPSPENIRPIQGRDSVKVERCGKNLFDIAQCRTASPGAAFGLTITADDTGLISVSGIPTVSNSSLYRFRLLQTDQVILTKGYKVKWFTVKGVVNTVYGIADDKSIVMTAQLSPNTSVDLQFRLMYYTGDEPTTYTPYIGSTNTLTLPSTVYGGEVDAVRGEGQETWKMLTLDGTEDWRTWGVDFRVNGRTGFYLLAVTDYDKDKNSSAIGSHYNYSSGTYGGTALGFGLTESQSKYLIISVTNDSLADVSSNAAAVSSFKSFLTAQYAAGTPVQIAYQLADSVPFTATGGAAIPALSGTNTVLTDADSLTVTGRADPIQTIAKLSDRIAALEAAATNITE